MYNRPQLITTKAMCKRVCVHFSSCRWFQVGGGGCKLGARSTARLRQHRADGSWSDDGTAYQDDLISDVDLSDDDEGADWEGDGNDEDESWGQQILTPKTSR